MTEAAVAATRVRCSILYLVLLELSYIIRQCNADEQDIVC
jgi:hypothetical protein